MRQPKPIEQRLKEGVSASGRSDVSHRQVPRPVMIAGRPDVDELAEPPDYLPADAKALWRRDVQRLVEVGIVDRVDRGGLEAMCTCYARALQAGRVIKAEGLFAAGGHGQIRAHPAVAIEQQSWMMFFRFANDYALTPVARTRLGLAEVGRRSLTAELEDKLGRRERTIVQ
jgi:P27 family predicted phage terminase small subunit